MVNQCNVEYRIGRPAPRRRIRTRQAQRGIAIFVVVLVLTVLSAVGMFAAHIAGLNQRASGYAKQGSQTSYVAQYGVDAITNEMGPGKAKMYLDEMERNPLACRANQGVTAGETSELTCYTMTSTMVQRDLDQSGNNAKLFEPDGGSLGSGQYHQPEMAHFRVELFDKSRVGPWAGSNQSTPNSAVQHVWRVTLTSEGRVYPEIPGGVGNCTTPQQREAVQVGGTRAVRAYIIAPEI